MVNLNPLVKTVLKTLEKNGFEAYLVGGAVRDHLLGLKTNDFDVATNALPSDIVKIFGCNLKGEKYGSFHLIQKGIHIDITTYRLESYDKNRHLKVLYTQNLFDDCKRRDFTINAIYMDKNGQKIDMYNGLLHLKEKKLVSIMNANEKLKEDPLRILRAIRFASLGFTIEKSLAEAIFANRFLVLELSLDKIRKELDKIFLANGFYLLRHFMLDEVLNINLDNIIYVNDLAGIWVQGEMYKKYPLEKEKLNHVKMIASILNRGTISLECLYEYGLYDCYVAADILGIKRKDVDKIYHKMVIHSKKDLKVNGKIVSLITNCEDKEIKNILKEIETLVLERKLKNNRKQIIKYLKRRSLNAGD